MLSKTIFSCHWRDQEQMPCAILPAIKKSSLANVCYKPKSHQTPLGTPLGQQSMIANKSRVKSLYSQRLWRAGGLNFFSGKRQGVTRSLFQFSRRDREFLSFNLMFETRMRISFSQSRASRREREFLFSILGFETRTRIEIDTILGRIFWIYIYCLFIDWYFQRKAGDFSKFLKLYVFFSQEIWMKISFFETRTRIFFYQSRVSRREREIEIHFSRSSGKKWSWFSQEFPGTGIPVTLCPEGIKMVLESLVTLTLSWRHQCGMPDRPSVAVPYPTFLHVSVLMGEPKG